MGLKVDFRLLIRLIHEFRTKFLQLFACFRTHHLNVVISFHQLDFQLFYLTLQLDYLFGLGIIIPDRFVLN